MGDLELSLDDIIKKKLKKTGSISRRNNEGNAKKAIRRILDQKSRVTKTQSITVNKNLRTGLKSAWIQGSQPAIGDARLKIIQKKRQKVTDARDKLSQIAKQTDARFKLNKLKEQKRQNLPTARILGLRSLPDRHILQRTVQSRINNSIYDEERMDYTDDDIFLSHAFPERSIINDDIYNYPYRSRANFSGLYRTIENDIHYSNRMFEVDKSKYSWTKPVEDLDIPVPRMNSKISLGINRIIDDRKDLRGNTPSWDIDDTPIVITKKIKPQETVGILKRSSITGVYDGPAVKIIKESTPPTKSKGPTRTLNERFCQDGNVSAHKISLIKAKLEASQKGDKNGDDPQSVIGHKIIVTNLVPSVTHEDVKELFEDVGELISSKVIRPGTAEVVYKLHKDAVEAVDVYHNRQLDGQPMKCLLVNNRLKTTKTAKPVVEVDMTAFRKALHKKSNS